MHFVFHGDKALNQKNLEKFKRNMFIKSHNENFKSEVICY